MYIKLRKILFIEYGKYLCYTQDIKQRGGSYEKAKNAVGRQIYGNTGIF